MTSMPASRSALAMTLTPRSCPSRPGLAMRMRSLRVGADGGVHRPRKRYRARPGPVKGEPLVGPPMASDAGPTGARRTAGRARPSRAHPRPRALREARARARREPRCLASTSSGRARIARRWSPRSGAGRPVVGFALFFHNYSTFLAGRGCTSRISSSCRTRGATATGASSSGRRAHRGRARLRPLRVEGAPLERAGHPLLQIPRARPAPRRLGPLPHRRRSPRRASRASQVAALRALWRPSRTGLARASA